MNFGPRLSLHLRDSSIVYLYPTVNHPEGISKKDSSLVCGSILLSLSRQKKVDSLTLNLVGVCDAYGGADWAYESTYPIKQSLALPLDNTTLTPGNHVFDFRILIPADTAPFQRSMYGRTRHYLQASLCSRSALRIKKRYTTPAVALWLYASPSLPGNLPDPWELEIEHISEDLGPLILRASSPYLTPTSLIYTRLRLLAPHNQISVVHLRASIAQTFVVNYEKKGRYSRSNDRTMREARPPPKRYKLVEESIPPILCEQERKRKRREQTTEDEGASREMLQPNSVRFDPLSSSRLQETPEANTPTHLPPLPSSSAMDPDSQYQTLQSQLEELQTRIREGAYNPPVYQTPSLSSSSSLPLSNTSDFPSTVDIATEFSCSALFRLPGDVLRPTTMEASVTPIRVSNRLILEVGYRLKPDGEVKNLGISKDITVGPCGCALEQNLLPEYNESPHNGTRTHQKRGYGSHCFCHITPEELFSMSGYARIHPEFERTSENLAEEESEPRWRTKMRMGKR